MELDYSFTIKKIGNEYSLSLSIRGVNLLSIRHKNFAGIEIELSKIRKIIQTSKNDSISEIKNKIETRWEQ